MLSVQQLLYLTFLFESFLYSRLQAAKVLVFHFTALREPTFCEILPVQCVRHALILLVNLNLVWLSCVGIYLLVKNFL